MPPCLARLALALGLALPGVTLSGAAAAQAILPCEGYIASAQNVMGPDYQRSFANGNIRFIGLDTVEPAWGWAYLMVTTYVTDQPGESCVVIGRQGNMGFSGMESFDRMDARYDPATGLTVRASMQIPDGAGNFVWQDIAITVNQATGQITAREL